jgi:hypothetical protein
MAEKHAGTFGAYYVFRRSGKGDPAIGFQGGRKPRWSRPRRGAKKLVGVRSSDRT